MLASDRAREINFYEELGLAPEASQEEIRDAFRALVRLLHPDQQTDAQLKDIAERQMRKLNRIYAVLSDPNRRREYDEYLEDEAGLPVDDEPVISPELMQVLRRVAWTAAIVVSAGLLIWWILAANTAPGPQSRVADQSMPPSALPASLSHPVRPPADQSSLIASLRADLKAVTLERDAAIHEIARLRGSGSAPQAAAPSNNTESGLPAVTMTELPQPSKLPVFASATLPRIQNPTKLKLAGFWFYARPAAGQRNKNQALYPPEYIEATISEQNGVTSGKYRARFQVVDRPISPDVSFTFTGPSGAGSQITFPWTGGGGAKGEVTLKLVSANSLRIDWNATELGTQQGLDSGTAVLTRRIE